MEKQRMVNYEMVFLVLIYASLYLYNPVDSMRCDFVKYPNSGCENSETQKCDLRTDLCECKDLFTVRYQGRCLAHSKIHEKCYTSVQCLTDGAKCLNESMHEIERPIPIRLEGNLNELDLGYCRCPNTSYYNHVMNRCERRLLGATCRVDEECNKSFMYCDTKEKICKCEKGFDVIPRTDTCYSIRLINFNSIETYVPGPICDTWDSASGRCKSHWETSKSWSSLMWKLAVLCVVLILLMMLLGGIQKARQNENILSWSRAMEELQVRNTRYNSGLRNSRWPAAPPEFSILRTGRNTFIAPINDDPPPYEEAIAISSSGPPSQNPPQYRDTCEDHNKNNTSDGN